VFATNVNEQERGQGLSKKKKLRKLRRKMKMIMVKQSSLKILHRMDSGRKKTKSGDGESKRRLSLSTLKTRSTTFKMMKIVIWAPTMTMSSKTKLVSTTMSLEGSNQTANSEPIAVASVDEALIKTAFRLRTPNKSRTSLSSSSSDSRLKISK